MAIELTRLLEKRLVIVTGKGGVGKSTISASLALWASRKHKRVLLAEVAAKEGLSHFFGVPEVGSKITEIKPNLWAVNIQPKDALKEYALMVLKLKTLYNLVFERKMVKSFLDAFPGLDELVMLGKIWYHTQEVQSRKGRPKYDMVIMDAPATGHAISMLRLPHVIVEGMTTGPLKQSAQRMLKLLQDPAKTSLQIVTLPEEMPVNEALELKRAVDEILKIPTGYLFINGVYPRLFNKQEVEDFNFLKALCRDSCPEIAPLMAATQHRLHRWKHLEQYRVAARQSLALPAIEIPFYFIRDVQFKIIGQIGQSISHQIAKHEKGRVGL